MAKVITVHSEKGGVGKTTLSINISICLAGKHKVCLVDLDGQASATKGLGVETEDTIYRYLKEGVVNPITSKYGVDVIAGDGGVFLQPEAQNKDCLNKLFETLQDKYDYIIVDTSPSLSYLSISAYCNSRYVISVAIYEIFALDGVRGVQDDLRGLKESFGCNAELLGISLQRYDARRNIHKILSKLYKDEFGNKLFEAIIPQCTSVSESLLVQEPVMTFAPKCSASKAYQELAKEIINRLKKG